MTTLIAFKQIWEVYAGMGNPPVKRFLFKWQAVRYVQYALKYELHVKIYSDRLFHKYQPLLQIVPRKVGIKCHVLW